jgi:ribosome-associated protein
MPNQSNVQSLALSTATTLNDTTLQLAQTIVQAANDRKGGDITLLNVAKVSTLTDYFVIVTGFSKVQVRAIAGSIADAVKETLQRLPNHVEGLAEGTWILQDYGDVIVHVQMPTEREFYNLEAFWGHADRIDVSALVN